VKRVVADSNQWISALIWGGKPLQLIELALQGEIDLAISPDILNETLEVLREKFSMDAEDLQKAEARSCSALRGW
jgi:putative PIN family toxin of toxin-antitoxin system